MSLFHLVPTLVCLFAVNALAIPLARNNIAILQKTVDDAVIFKLGDITYLANTVYPRATVKLSGHHYIGLYGSSVPITVISTNATSFTQQSIEHTIQSYTEGDDVFNADFLEAIYLASSAGAPNVDASALDYLARMNVKHTFAGSMIKLPSGYVTVPMRTGAVNGSALAPGPYLATFSAGSISLAPVYRLYEDSYRDFLFGTYDTADGSGSFTGLPRSLPNFGYPAIPVPSQLYYWDDPRPFAGFRVAVKDLFDMKGLITSGGSQAWAYISEPANETAPAIQRIVDLGGVLVGKFKLAQFASGANPWDWQDEHYPFNPRGDGWLTCSASSSGAGCSIAAYEWLDYAIGTDHRLKCHCGLVKCSACALRFLRLDRPYHLLVPLLISLLIGSDTGSSMRRPAAVSGTFGNRPSQGMITLERVIPLAVPQIPLVSSRGTRTSGHTSQSTGTRRRCTRARTSRDCPLSTFPIPTASQRLSFIPPTTCRSTTRLQNQS